MLPVILGDILCNHGRMKFVETCTLDKANSHESGRPFRPDNHRFYYGLKISIITMFSATDVDVAIAEALALPVLTGSTIPPMNSATGLAPLPGVPTSDPVGPRAFDSRDGSPIARMAGTAQPNDPAAARDWAGKRGFSG
jgi:hypothetical protein